jgi:hypothetical protein
MPAVLLFALALLLVRSGPAAAQVVAAPEVPRNARVLMDAVALAPTLRVTNLGWEDNVFHTADNVQGDFTATVSPAVQAWFRLPWMIVRSRSEVDFVYYREVSQFRSVDTENAGRVDLLLGPVRPFLAGDWANTRHRRYRLPLLDEGGAGEGLDPRGRNLEIDDPVRRRDWSWNGGADVMLTGKSIIGVVARQSHLDYDGDATYLGTDLSRYLRGSVRALGARYRYALTPLTTVGADVERFRSEFPGAPERDADGVHVTSVVEFRPLATLKGTARMGVRRRTFVDGDLPTFKGSVAHVDLAYTLLGRTRLAVGFRRDLANSFRVEQRDYLQTGLELSVTQRLGNTWDVRGMLGRFNLAYGVEAAPVPQAVTSARERVRSYGVDIGRHVGEIRVGFQVARQSRSSDFAGWRGYERTRLASSMSYVF